MGIWIRSQDKLKLGNYKNIFVFYSEIRGESFNDCELLGVYATQERAIEVLNQIQMVIQSLEEDKIYNISLAGTDYKLRDLCFTYEMPEN